VSHPPPQPAPSAVRNAERTLAASAAVLRLGALLLLLAAVPALASDPHPLRAGLVAAAVAVESALFAARCLRAGVLRRSWAALDLLAVALALFWSVWPVTHGGPVESPLFNFALVSAVIAGLPPGPWWATLATVVPVAAATVTPALLSHDPSAPAWTLVPDGLATPSAAFIAWFVARRVRRSARDYDGHRALIVRRAEVLARERERLRHSAALQARLLVTLGDVVAAGAVTEPALANQLDAEVRWLRRVVDVGLVDPPPELAGGLRALVSEKSATGPRVVLELPDDMPELPAAARQALLDATREALTNVAKHAGVRAAGVRVTVDGGGMIVEIVDAGRGYDPAASTPGTGLIRSIRRALTEAGGTAEVHSAPGLGTRVVLRVPR
jgi:signal transduction histidine kinase